MNLYDKILKFQLEIKDLPKKGISKIGDKYVPYWLLSDILIRLKELCKTYNVVITHEDDSDKEFVVNRLEKQVEIIYWKEYTLADLDKKEGTEHCNILTFPALACGTNTNISRAKGSAETYAYRYFLMNLLLLSEDELDPDYDSNSITTTDNYHNYMKDQVYKDQVRIKKNNSKDNTTVTLVPYKPHREPKQVISDNTNWTKSWIPTDKQISSFEGILLNYPKLKYEFIEDHMERLMPKSNSEFLSKMGKDYFNELMDRRECILKKIEWTKEGMKTRLAISLQKWKDKQEKE